MTAAQPPVGVIQGSPAVPSGRQRTTLVAIAAVAAMIAVAVAVGYATRTDRQLPALAIAAVSILLLLSLRWPIVSLYFLVLLIPRRDVPRPR